MILHLKTRDVFCKEEMEVLLLSPAPLPVKIFKAKLFRRFSMTNGVPNQYLPHLLKERSWVCFKQSMWGKDKHFVYMYDAWNYESPKHRLNAERSPLVSGKLVPEKKLEGLAPDSSNLSALLLYSAHYGLFSKVQVIWDEMLNSATVPDAQVVSQLINIYGSMGDFNAVARILRDMQLKNSEILPDIYALAISCFGKGGQLECMEMVINEMVSMGYSVDSAAGNSYILYYSTFGSLEEMEVAYGRLKRSRILIEEEAIRAIAFAYIKENKYYSLGQFLRDVGLGRRNVGNLIWNLLLLSYAANFKMKSLQREFVRMVEAGFNPDLNTFNIRALAFSKMSLLWDLHLSLEHMKHDSVLPDLVTYGCVVDAYLDKRLARNLKFALSKQDWNNSVSIFTDPLVFEVMGKGDFHSSSEVVLENVKRKDWTYKMLIDTYVKKKFRSNQIFWNY